MKQTGNYYYGARYFNPKWSTWLSVDPLAEKYPSISSYAYVAQNPIKYIDPDGMRVANPHDEFESLRAAATDFAVEYNGLSITYNFEITTSFYKATNENGDTYYSYTTPEARGAGIAASDNDLSSAPSDADFVGDGHTHAGDVDVIQIEGKDYSGVNRFTEPADIEVYRNYKQKYFKRDGNLYGKKVMGYLVTPNGSLLEYDPYKEYGFEKTKSYNKPIVTDNIPSDPASKSLRQNNIPPSKVPSVLPSDFDPNVQQKEKVMNRIYVFMCLFLINCSASKEIINPIRDIQYPLVHKYGTDIVPNEEVALKLAEVIWKERYKNYDIDSYKPFKINLTDNDKVWDITASSFYGVFRMKINKNTAEVLNNWVER